MARVASIRHISSVGNVPLDELVNKLRVAVGQPVTNVSYSEEEYFGAQPYWFSTDKVSATIEEDELDDKNKMTLVVIHEKAKDVAKGEIRARHHVPARPRHRHHEVQGLFCLVPEG